MAFQQKIKPSQQMISSCTGAFITSVLVTPLDVVKVRLQAQQKEIMRKKCYVYYDTFVADFAYWIGEHGNTDMLYANQRNQLLRARHFTGTADAFVKIARSEGITSLWSGLPPTLVMSVPATVIYFTVYDQLRDRLGKQVETAHKPLWIPVIAGASARIFAASFVSPIELVRTKMQSKKLSYNEIGRAVKSLIQCQGFRSLWRGLGPTILRDVPFSSIYWSCYERLKQIFQQEKPTFWFSFAAGASSGTVAAILTLPFDVIKTHRQIELGEMDFIQTGKKKGTSTYRLLLDLYQKRGFRALFTGIVPRIIKVAPACAIMISTYEFGKQFFFQYNANRMDKEC